MEQNKCVLKNNLKITRLYYICLDRNMKYNLCVNINISIQRAKIFSSMVIMLYYMYQWIVYRYFSMLSRPIPSEHRNSTLSHTVLCLNYF